MKKLVLLFSVFVAFLSASYAQDNRISLRVNYLFSFTMKGSINDTTPKYNNNAFQILPSLGYYHTFKNKVGVGIEFGYRNSKYSEKSSYGIDTYQVLNSIHEIHYVSYFICPSVYETFYFNKYIANLSFTIPIEYISKLSNYLDNTLTNRQINTTTQSIEYQRWPRILQYALYLQAGAYRKIYKGLYIGAELAIGPSFESRFGTGKDGYDKVIRNGVTIHESPIVYRSEHYTQVRLVSQPTISIQYRFNKK